MVIWANHNLRAAIGAMREVSRRIRDEESLVGVEGDRVRAGGLRAAGNAELEEAERRYLGPPPAGPAPWCSPRRAEPSSGR